MDTVHEEALAAGLRPDGTIDINAAVRSLPEGLLNAVMDEQASELGAPRNGYRERSLDTCVGRVTLRIPKLREGSYFPDDIVGCQSRTDTALASAVCDMWVSGISTRKVERAAADLGVECMSRSRVSRLRASLAAVDPRGAELLEEAGPHALAYLAFPREHALWVRTNNVCERMSGEIKRRTRVVQVFPSAGSLVRLVGAVCCDQNDAWACERNFIDRRSLGPGYEWEPLPEEPGGERRVLRLVEEAFDRKRKAA